MNVKDILYPKHYETYRVLVDSPAKYVTYGGSAGPGKTFMGVIFLWVMSTSFPNTRYYIGRDNLKDTRESVVVTWIKASKMFNLGGWKQSDDGFKFSNGSEVVFLDLSFYPRKDPLYERLGSKEFTMGWIEEAGQCHYLAFEVLKSRTGRHMNVVYNIPGKILITCNPKKNWLYHDFYKPFRLGTLPSDRAFIPALAKDNPGLSQDYLDSLDSISDKSLRSRLRDGDWEYDDNPNALCSYESIMQIFDNDHLESGQGCIVADIATTGSDRAIIAVFLGGVMVEYKAYEKCTTPQIQTTIRAFQTKYNISSRNCVADQDGVGGGVVQSLGIVGFSNGGRPIEEKNGIDDSTGYQNKFTPNYQNLKTQCAYLLADSINNDELYVQCELPQSEKDMIIEELECLQSYQSDKDGKLRILPKEKIKELIGRSPDWLDVLIMREYFKIRPKQKRYDYAIATV